LKGGEAMTLIDCKAIFNLQKEILDAPMISDADKIAMLKNSIENTLANANKEKEK
jgi:hypothetical protein